MLQLQGDCPHSGNLPQATANGMITANMYISMHIDYVKVLIFERNGLKC